MAARCSGGGGGAALAVLLLLAALAGSSSAQLSTGYYSSSCPGLYKAVRSVVQSAVAKEKRMGASIVRLFFHDCFVQVRTYLLLLSTMIINNHSLEITTSSPTK
jgi:peroxidase